MLSLSDDDNKIIMQQISRINGVLPFCSNSPLPATNVATAIFIMRKIQAGLFRNPRIRKMPPKNSNALHSQALKTGKGIFSVFKVSANLCILL